MPLITVVDAILAQLAASSDLSDEFGTDIKRGMERIKQETDIARAIRVLSSDVDSTPYSYNDTEVERASLVFVISIFFEPDFEKAELVKSNHDHWIRAAIFSDLTFGGVCLGNTRVGVTSFREHMQIDGVYYVIIPVACRLREAFS